ncbi:MAG: GntR family transcriptional regulator, partial [Bacillota bacterium]|nr:GntR family transcriptional regulator [Bacillota bacterium]
MRHPSIAEDICIGLAERIASGMHPMGTLLPSCRSLSSELGVNKNTISKAFSLLQEKGLARPVPGVGMIVTNGAEPNGGTGSSHVGQRLEQVIHQARMLGMTQEQVTGLFRGAIHRCYGGLRISALLVECNMWDARSLAQDIKEELDIRVKPVVISRFLERPEQYANEYDLLLTSFYHLGELYAACPATVKDRFIALQDQPNARSLLALARISPTKRLGLIAAHDRTLDTMERTAQSCGYMACSRALLDDDEQVRDLLTSTDAIIVSERCRS